jgi:hypothetical protein
MARGGSKGQDSRVNLYAATTFLLLRASWLNSAEDRR